MYIYDHAVNILYITVNWACTDISIERIARKFIKNHKSEKAGGHLEL